MTMKMIATDMDGTFLNEKGTFDRARFRRILRELQRRKILFVAASGNNMNRLSLIFDDLAPQVTFVADNGAHLVEDGKTILYQSLDRTDLQGFLDFFGDKLADYRTVFSGMESSYTLSSYAFYKPVQIEEEEFKTFFSHIQRLEDFSQIPAMEAISKVTMMVFDEDYEAIMTDFNEHFSGNLVAVSSGYGALDFIQKGIHKAWGLGQLMERYGIQADEIMTFGDGGNDMEMLSMTPHSYAMANASDQVKTAAKHLAASHRENGVMQVIEAVLLQDSEKILSGQT